MTDDLSQFRQMRFKPILSDELSQFGQFISANFDKRFESSLDSTNDFRLTPLPDEFQCSGKLDPGAIWMVDVVF